MPLTEKHGERRPLPSCMGIARSIFTNPTPAGSFITAATL